MRLRRRVALGEERVGPAAGLPACASCSLAIVLRALERSLDAGGNISGGSSTARLYALTVGWSFTDHRWTYPAVSPNANASPEDDAARDASLCPIKSRGACEKNPAPELPGPPRSASCVCTSPLSPPSTTVPLNLGWNATATAPAGNCSTLSTRADSHVHHLDEGVHGDDAGSVGGEPR